MGRKLGYREGDLPRTEDLSGRLLRLPLFFEITEGEQERVVRTIDRYLKDVRRPAPSVPGSASSC
jgi:dTDP-4-amino-4,6-dideoxygalactose transaminase